MPEQNERLPYPSDLSDKEWEIIKLHIPTPRTNRGKKRFHSYREIVNAIFYLLRSGCAWRMLPHEFPPWKTVPLFPSLEARWNLGAYECCTENRAENCIW